MTVTREQAISQIAFVYSTLRQTIDRLRDGEDIASDVVYGEVLASENRMKSLRESLDKLET